ncbi:MAG: folate-binding protein YgfZ [Alphaproteobacteria bacterium]|nr:folate-binding protein [Alphaproteobacteria bacterium]MDE2111934.1 folate-binding protein YgfZ [Alphaproteobacteria bacterium]MDE2493123.1 folate-binding protein YgfZ [Alphaproteobacteria bacterium]
MITELTDRAVIALTGPEARPFLQGLVTNDVKDVSPGRAAYAALLTPQGKILFDFLIAAGDDELLIDCRHEAREALIKRLSMYRLRSKVDISRRDDIGVFTGLNSGVTDPRLQALGGRALMPKHEPAQDGAQDYLAKRLELGVPEGIDFGSDQMFALDANLDELHAISYEKGCYVGQELTARMKYRGKDRKRLLTITTKDGSPLPASGIAVTADGRDVGVISSRYGARGFTLVRLDRLTEASGAALEAAGVPVDVTKPIWLSP